MKKYSNIHSWCLCLVLLLQGTNLISSDPITTPDSDNISYSADISSGKIGFSVSESFDSPTDNVFLVNISEALNPNMTYELSYKVKGISNLHGVPRSINEQATRGGYIVRTSDKWQSCSEVLNSSWIHEGTNHIMFYPVLGLDKGYEIKDVQIVRSHKIQERPIVIISDSDLLQREGQFYLRGFTDEFSTLEILGNKYDIIQGQFEQVIDLSNLDNQENLELRFTDINGKEHLEILNVGSLSDADFLSPIEPDLNRNSAFVMSGASAYLTMGMASMKVPEGATQTQQELSISKLRQRDVAALNAGIINVTGQAKGYRFLPSQIFQKSVQLTIPYNNEDIPAGYSPYDIRTFYFDISKKTWKTIDIDSINLDENIIHLSTDHFTDYINGIIQLPESPASSAYVPTQMADIKAADPVSQLNIMAPPQANYKGDATLSFPIEIPAGRQGIQPSLALNYNSSGGSSWVGLGWNVNIPAISIDTRWGSPIFDEDYETELYSLNGEQLVTNKSGTVYMPNRHEDGCITGLLERNTSGDRLYHERKLGSFSKIQRLGTNPEDYYWIVTDAQGTKYYYGGLSSAEDQYTLGNETSGISYWALARVQDVHGNYMEYSYKKNVTNTDNLSNGISFYVSSITYTKHQQDDVAPYKVQFSSSPSGRSDATISGNLGFKKVDNELLSNIDVMYNGDVIRSYVLNYDEGRFFKTRLISIEEHVNVSTQETAIVTVHDFDYHDELGEDCDPFVGGPSVEIVTPNVSDDEQCVVEASIEGSVWSDSGENGIPNIQDASDTNVSSILLALYDRSTNSSIAFTYSDTNGNYKFDVNSEGDYFVLAYLPQGYSAVLLDGGDDTVDNDFFVFDASGQFGSSVNVSITECDDIVDLDLGIICVNGNCGPEVEGIVTNLDCNASNGPANGSIILEVSGLGDFTYAWSTPNGSGLMPTDKDQSNLSAGLYTVVVTDSDGVSTVTEFLLEEPAIISILGNTTDLFDCLINGSIDLSVTGGSEPYSYTWTGPNGYLSTEEDISNLGAGQYNLTVTDNNNCSQSEDYEIEDINPLFISRDETTHINDIDISVFDGTSPYQYLWTTNGGEITDPNTQDQFDLVPGYYTVIVEDACGVQVTEEYLVPGSRRFTNDEIDKLFTAQLSTVSEGVKGIFKGRIRIDSNQVVIPTFLNRTTVTLTHKETNQQYSTVTKSKGYFEFFLDSSLDNYILSLPDLENYGSLKEPLNLALYSSNPLNRDIQIIDIVLNEDIVNVYGSLSISENTPSYVNLYLPTNYIKSDVLTIDEFGNKVSDLKRRIDLLTPDNFNTSNIHNNDSVNKVHLKNILESSFLSNFSIDGYGNRLSSLGSNVSLGGSTGGGVGFGLGSNLLVKGQKVTLDVGVGGSGSLSKSLIANLDMNGDGLSDIIKERFNGLFYYRHIVERTVTDQGVTIQHSYADPVKLDIPVSRFFESTTVGMNTNLSLNAGGSEIGGSVGMGYSGSMSFTNVFFTDANGDGLTDISINGIVLFNTLDRARQTPTFSVSSESTENLIVIGSEVELEQPSIPEDFNFNVPSYDVVKVWEATADGEIVIETNFPLTSAKLSIETDNNGFYSLTPSQPMLTGTCRLFKSEDFVGDPLPEFINALPQPEQTDPVDLYCKELTNIQDPCENDHDNDGINDCLDCDIIGGGDCENDCLDILEIDDPVISMTEDERVDQYIIARNVIGGAADVTYTAEERVIMEAGFSVDNINGFYRAYIGPCATTDLPGGISNDDNPTSETSTLRVKKGQKLYFRSHVNDDSDVSEVYWDPEVRYVTVSGEPINNDEIDDNGLNPLRSKYSDAFILANDQGTLIPPGNVETECTLSWDPVNLDNITDDLTFSIERLDMENSDNTGTDISSSVLWEETIMTSSVLPTISFPTGNQSLEKITLVDNKTSFLKFNVEANSNVDWQDVNWDPLLSCVIKDVLPDEPDNEIIWNTDIAPIVNYSTYKNYNFAFAPTSLPRWKSYNTYNMEQAGSATTYYFFPDLDSELSSFFNGCSSDGNPCPATNLTFLVKYNGKVAGHMEASVDENGISAFTNSDGSSFIKVDITDPTETEVSIQLISDGGHWSDQVLRILELPSLQPGIEFENQSELYSKSVGKVSTSPTLDLSSFETLTRVHVQLLHKETKLDGQYYRDWGQFLYDENKDPYFDSTDQSIAKEDDFGRLINIVRSGFPTITEEQAEFFQNFEVNSLDSDFGSVEQIEQSFEQNEDGDIVTNIEELQAIDLFEMLYFYPVPAKEYIPTTGGDLQFSEKWRGLSEFNFAAQYSASPIGLDRAINLQIGSDPTTINFQSVDKGAFSLSKIVISNNISANFGLSAQAGGSNAAAGANATIFARSTNLSDYFDINGDRYPDILKNDFVQFTSPTGGLFSTTTGEVSLGGELSLDNLGRTGISSFGASASGTYGNSSDGNDHKSTGGQKKLNFLQFAASIASNGLSADATTSFSNTEMIWIDINGDGLSDKVYTHEGNPSDDENLTPGIYVSLNVGQTNGIYESPKYWGDIKLNFSENISGGAGIGFALGQGNGFSGGASFGLGKSNLEGSLYDFNNDGLLDYLGKEENGEEEDEEDNDNYYIVYNTGTGFDTTKKCPIDLSMNTNALTSSQTLNGSATFGIPIPIFGVTFKVPINVNGAGTTSQNITLKNIKDYDGDGYPDFLHQRVRLSPNLEVKHSVIGKTNKLKSVTTSIGGNYAMDYELSAPTYDMPSSRWVMNTVSVTDLLSTEYEGERTVSKFYTYENGKYDRRERQFNGYEYVRSIDKDENGEVYRQAISKYDNKSYYLNGSLQENHIVSGEVTPIVGKYGLVEYVPDTDSWELYQSTINDYELHLPVLDNDIWSRGILVDNNYDIGGTEGRGAAFPSLKKVTKKVYEGEAIAVQSEDVMTYDDYGRVTQFDHFGSSARSSYISTITYFDINEGKNLISIPKNIQVLEGTTVLRSREVTEINTETGDVLAMRVDDGEAATDDNYSMSYDIYGNLNEIVYPPAQNGDALTRTIEYDTDYHKYPEKTKDAFGSQVFESSTEYDARFDIPVITEDVSGNIIQYAIDDLGRIEKVTGPKADHNSSDPYTIKFEYHNNAGEKPYSITHHYNEEGDDISTYTFSNGLGQAVQVKKDISYFDPATQSKTSQVSISGLITKDRWGRPIRQYHPNRQSGEYTTFNPNLLIDCNGGPCYSSTQYDILDRPVIAVDAFGSQSVIEYSVSDGKLLTRSTVQRDDEFNVITESLKDIDGRQLSTVSVDETTGERKDVHYGYDGIGQVLTVTDEEGNFTVSTYDLAGKLLTWKHPDAGLNTYTYDNLGNKITHITANDALIEYTYDAYSRPLSVIFPDYADDSPNINNVSYTYWPAEASTMPNNNTGRVQKIEDASGIQQFEYGSLGETIKTVRTIHTPGLEPQTFVHTYRYDSWNRIQEMSYPGGEMLEYNYDEGGLLTQILSSATGTDLITDIGYDHFEQKVFCSYGNGATTSYDYTSQLRRLNNLTVSSNAQTLLDNTYTYERIGNVSGILNNAAIQSGLGGGYSHTYNYDNFNRLAGAEGEYWGINAGTDTPVSNYKLTMTYGNLHRITGKNQEHYGGTTPAENTYNNIYKYRADDGAINDQPNLLTSIEDNLGNVLESFTYDNNGNMLTHVGGQESKAFIWDESNMMKAINIADNTIQHYVYDANGERVLKGQGVITTFSVNGGNGNGNGNNGNGNGNGNNGNGNGNNGNNNGNSNGSVVEGCGVPFNFTATTVSDTEVAFSWTGYEDANKYRFHYRVADSSDDWTKDNNVTTTSINITGLEPGVVYEAKIKSICTGGPNSDFSELKYFFTGASPIICGIPTELTAILSSGNSADLSWVGYADATNYSLRYRKDRNDTWTVIETSETSYALTGLEYGEAYRVQVRAFCAESGWEPYTEHVYFVTQPAIPSCQEPVVISTNVITNQSIEVRWTSSTAEEYRLRYRKYGVGASWTVIQNVTSPYLLQNLLVNTTYQIEVRVKCDGTWLAWTDSHYETTPRTAVPTTLPGCDLATGISAENVTTNSAAIQWNNHVEAIDYRVSYKEVGVPGTTNLYTAGNTNTLLIGQNLNPNSFYRVRLKTLCASGWSDWSEIHYFKTLPEPLPCTIPEELLATDIGQNTATLTWSAYEDATEYRVRYRPVTSSDWTFVTLNTNYITLSGLSVGTAYEYRVRASCNGELTSQSPFHYFMTDPDPIDCVVPTTLVASPAGCTSMSIDWQGSPDAVSYLIQYREFGASNWIEEPTDAAPLLINGLEANTPYELRIAATCPNGLTDFTPSTFVVTLSESDVNNNDPLADDPSVTGGDTPSGTDAEGNTTILTGEPGDDYIAIGNYTTYVSPYIVVGGNNMVTTHYYSGTERIASRLGGHVCEYSNLSEEELSIDLDQKQVSDLKSVMTDFGIAQFTISAETPDPEDCHLSGDCPTNLYFYHPDHLGSSTFLTDESGDPYQFFMYLPFGETMIEQRASGSFTPYKYNAKEMDEETGLYYYGARYYDARLSRFLSVDPLADAPANIGTSPYTYVWNNPINAIDPDGRHGESIHKDKYGNVIAEYHDGDNNTYIHGDLGGDGQHIDGQRSQVDQRREYFGTGGGGRKVDGVLTKILKTGAQGLNAYAGYTEAKAGAALAAVPSGVSQVVGAYFMGDGAARIGGSGVSIYGIWTDNIDLENAPTNLLGTVGFLIDSQRAGEWTTGGDAQFAFEVMGDFGLSKRRLMESLSDPKKSEGLMNMINRVNDVTRPYRKVVQEKLFPTVIHP